MSSSDLSDGPARPPLPPTTRKRRALPPTSRRRRLDPSSTLEASDDGDEESPSSSADKYVSWQAVAHESRDTGDDLSASASYDLSAGAELPSRRAGSSDDYGCGAQWKEVPLSRRDSVAHASSYVLSPKVPSEEASPRGTRPELRLPQEPAYTEVMGAGSTPREDEVPFKPVMLGVSLAAVASSRMLPRATGNKYDMFDVVLCKLSSTPTVNHAKHAAEDEGVPYHGGISTRREVVLRACGINWLSRTRLALPRRDPTKPTRGAEYKARALRAFKRSTQTKEGVPDLLCFAERDKIQILEVCDDGWGRGYHLGSLAGEAAAGWFPLCLTQPLWHKYARPPYAAVTSVEGGTHIMGVWSYSVAITFHMEEIGMTDQFARVRARGVDSELGHATYALRMLAQRRLRCRLAVSRRIVASQIGDIVPRPDLSFKRVLGVFVCKGNAVDGRRLIPLACPLHLVSEDKSCMMVSALFYEDIDRKLFGRPRSDEVVFTLVVDVEIAPLSKPIRFTRPMHAEVFEWKSEFRTGTTDLQNRRKIRDFPSFFEIATETPVVGTSIYRIKVCKHPRQGEHPPREVVVQPHG